MAPTFLTSAQAAQLLGVTAATVKRWSDAGLLPCVRTAGAHRRFDPAEVARLVDGRRKDEPLPGDTWADHLLDPDPAALHLLLLEERARLGAWWRVAERLGQAVRVVGERWEQGRLSIVDEHAASERLSRALARRADTLPARAGAPRVLLASAEGDDHTLGLALAELVLREWGWATLWAGRNAPAADLAAALEAGRADVLALSASVASRPESLARELELLAPVVTARGVRLLAGGAGPWPDPLPWGTRIRDFDSLRTFLQAEDVRRGGIPIPESSHP